MRPFAYERPDRLADALALLAGRDGEARPLAGGTDLIIRIRDGSIRPATVVDVKGIAEFSRDIRPDDGWLRIGARTTMIDLLRDDRIRRDYAALAEAAAYVGSAQIRNRATLAGNICNASPAADTVPALLVYNAVANVVGPTGSRGVPLAEFFTGPGRTVLTRGELLESVDLPFPAQPVGAAFGRITRRRGVDLATINLCGLIGADGVARFAYGAVAPTPFVAVDSSGALVPTGPDTPARAAALRALFSRSRPITDVRGSQDYRSAMLEVMTERTWRTAAGRLRGRLEAGSP